MPLHAAPPSLRRFVRILALLLIGASGALHLSAAPADPPFEPVRIPKWVYSLTRMTFATGDQIETAAKAGCQAVQTNLVWPYYPLRRDGGGLTASDAGKMRDLVTACHTRGMKLILGLPPFPPVSLVRAHPEWRVHPDDTAAVEKLEPREDNLGTRIGCNNGPWGDYLIDVCGELVQDYGIDGYSFDGNYHPPLCFCAACKASYRHDAGRDLPPKVNLDDVRYREYLVWRGERLEQFYVRLQQRIKGLNPDAAIINWSANAGRYGHFLTSPRAMSTRMNLLFDMPMQEWWLDETNLGASVAPAFGAAYIRAVAGGRPSACEPYLMSRGNPYGTDSFPPHERLCRVLLALTNGSTAPLSYGWPGFGPNTSEMFAEIRKRDRWTTNARSMPWAAQLVSEQTRQFYAYRDIADRFLSHNYGVFRAAMEEHLPLDLINDWDVSPENLKRYRVLVLPNSAALSNAQLSAIREYVRAGGGLVATGEASLEDELGRPRSDFGLADLFGVSFHGRPKAPGVRPQLDANFAVTVDENYWKQRIGVATLSWQDSLLTADAHLAELVPTRSVRFKGPLAAVSEPAQSSEVVARMTPEGATSAPLPAVIVRNFGRGRVVYMAACLDAANFSYGYPYQRRLLARALELAASQSPPIQVQAPMCVQSTFFEQSDKDGRRIVVHLFNGLDTAAHHGTPATDVPLREESVPIHGIRVRFAGVAVRHFHVEPGGIIPSVRRDKGVVEVEIPPLDIHAMLVAERK